MLYMYVLGLDLGISICVLDSITDREEREMGREG